MLTPHRDVVLFLGAGFSFNAGLPTMPNFGNEARKQEIREHYEKNDRNAASLYFEALETFEKFQNLLIQNQVVNRRKAEDMETVFCIAEALHESAIKNITIKGVKKNIKVLIEEIKLWLWKTYQQFPPENPKRKLEPDTDIEVYKKFFGIIKEIKFQNRITVLTTNYDLVFEYCSYLNNLLCAYPDLGESIIKVGFGNKFYISQFHDHLENFLVCKLHGSVNYFENSKRNKLFIANDLGDEQSQAIGRSGKFNNRPAILAYDSIWNIRKTYNDKFIPAIIPPTYAKLHGHIWLRKIWKTAFDALKHSEKIIFIGYRFPESDGFMQALFQAAFVMRGNISKPNIYLIDPNKSVHRRYNKFFKSMLIKNSPMTLKDAVNNEFLYNILPK